ncbi:hypothetical protein V5P93_002470 [Actinokineospora auranticolor]|uniref:Uncharacterized protein n=1 Tax=Actinokineospora auranticolor TaxID=155976 RepID=A0A2S6GMN3_9PSEU|nr:hypothetical protein [Actinokineospora auranticolor]PPK66499.1 hypothetical protein CLV40_110203 [Actinokineospora auranticolor]
MFRFSTLAAALVMSSPALYGAFVSGSLDPVDAVIRFLIAVPLAAILLAIPRAIFNRYNAGQPDHELQSLLVQAGAVRTDRPHD